MVPTARKIVKKPLRTPALIQVPTLPKAERLTAIEALNADLRIAAGLLTPDDVKVYCQLYYGLQGFRKRVKSRYDASKEAEQLRAKLAGRAPSEAMAPNVLLAFEFKQFRTLEAQMKAMMLGNARSKLAGRWLLSIFGIGPVIAAGLLAHIDVKKAPHVGNIYNFAGLNPNVKWMKRAAADAWVKEHWGIVKKEGGSLDDLLLLAAAKLTRRHETLYRDATTDFKPGSLSMDDMPSEENSGIKVIGSSQSAKPLTLENIAAAIARRPWNAALKLLCYHARQSFKKFSNKEGCFYGHLYRDAKVKVIARNINGGFAELAAKTLQERNIVDAKTRAIYESGKLPPGRLDAWAERHAVKIFLSHLHHVLFEIEYSKPPAPPWILVNDPEKHSIFISPPNWPMREGAAEAEDGEEDED